MSCYEITPVDTDISVDYEPIIKQIWSKRDFDIGFYTDEELNPITQTYQHINTDTATIESAHSIVPEGYTKKLYSLAVFGRNFGELCILLEPELVPFKINRGDVLLLQREFIGSEPEEDEYDDEDDSDTTYEREPLFHILYNFNTAQKNNHAKLITNQYDSYERDKVVVVSINTIDKINYAKKHLLIYSQKFLTYISFMIDESQAMFLSKENDKVLIEQYFNENTEEFSYRLLSNTTIDDIRTKFVTKYR